MRFLLRATTVSLVACFTLLFGCSSPYANNSADYDALHRFSQIVDIVEQYYVRDIPQNELIDGAIKGMLQSLDPHSTFMSEKEFASMQETTTGEFFGIGAELSMENGQPIVISPIEDTPADRAGIKSGDIILSVGGVLTFEKTLTESVAMIRGKKGSEVELVLLRKGESAPITVKLKRDAIPYTSVKVREIEPGYQWVRLSFFSERTTQELHEALATAQKKGPIKGIILDLRNNPGGILDQAASVSDTFLTDGTIVSMRGRDNNVQREFKASKQSTDIAAPMVVLVNSGSASASEIVAGALRDQKRAFLIGEPTFGKGSVQNLIPLSDGTGLKLTIALYYTPSGKSIQAEGIVPDILVPFEIPREGKNNGLILREKDLNKHLDQTAKTDTSTPNKDTKQNVTANTTEVNVPEDKPVVGLSKEATEWLTQDNQLRLAHQLVKSLPTIKDLK